MYLEKLEIQGFKSFANKNMLVFPGMVNATKRGITAVVGPNGSGKSNIADAVRWALGEQSMKTLRGKKSEDIIFSGSDKKGKLGMAEVSLHLNNEDKKSPIDYSEIVLTRRLYRTGESEYILNNSRVRLADVQMLLAKAKFGQKTYSVIGQGLVEGFLNTSLAERKEFFDEATGVKQFQIKRDESLNKLRASYENLNQVSMLLVEIEPRVKSLTRQVSKLNKRSELEKELKELQINYYGKIWHEISGKFNEYNGKFLELEKAKRDKEKKLDLLNNELEKIAENNSASFEFENWQKELVRLQSAKDEMTRQLARINAQMEVKLDSLGKFDLSWLNNKKDSLALELKNIKDEADGLAPKLSVAQYKQSGLNTEWEGIQQKLNQAKFELQNLSVKKNDNNSQQANEALKNALEKLEAIKNENDIEELKNLLHEAREELKKAIKLFAGEAEKEKVEKIQAEIIDLSQKKESLSTEINQGHIQISAWNERLNIFKEKQVSLSAELNSIESKLKQNAKEINTGDIEKEKEDITQKMNSINNEIALVQEKIEKFKEQEEGTRAKLFAAQKNIQIIQNEINSYNLELNDLKINSTRYETRLEDLEVEIRSNLGSLKEIKQKQVEGPIDKEAALDKINSLKHQLEQIGGIDPEIEKEYIETKERFDFLTHQLDDLDSAINSLEKVIKELDETIRDRFDKEFKIIAEKFNEYYKILFNGGSAKIIKVLEQDLPGAENEDTEKETKNSEEENVKIKTLTESSSAGKFDLKKIKFLKKHNATGLAGIEIQATPPGKKISSISMLSGGERALTAIALICAIISANPSPFVVLDEVDAALDEANSERLAKILDDLSHRTQFIVITHNRASMRRANVLYGVTMQDDGVSKLLSIKLDEAKVK